MQLPAFVEFIEPVPSLDIKAGDRAWVTRDSATLVRSIKFDQIYPQLDLSKPVALRVPEA